MVVFVLVLIFSFSTLRPTEKIEKNALFRRYEELKTDQDGTAYDQFFLDTKKYYPNITSFFDAYNRKKEEELLETIFQNLEIKKYSSTKFLNAINAKLTPKLLVYKDIVFKTGKDTYPGEFFATWYECFKQLKDKKNANNNEDEIPVELRKETNIILDCKTTVKTRWDCDSFGGLTCHIITADSSVLVDGEFISSLNREAQRGFAYYFITRLFSGSILRESLLRDFVGREYVTNIDEKVRESNLVDYKNFLIDLAIRSSTGTIYSKAINQIWIDAQKEFDERGSSVVGHEKEEGEAVKRHLKESLKTYRLQKCAQSIKK